MVRLAWTASDYRGDPITAYAVLIETSTPGLFLADPTDCPAADPTLLARAFCEIPLATLRDAGFTALSQGDLIRATVTATNAFGASDPSPLNTGGPRVEMAPHRPASAHARGALTGETALRLELAPLTGDETGGSPILSYVVLWDAGLGGDFAPVLGDASPNLLTSVSISSGVASGVVY